MHSLRCDVSLAPALLGLDPKDLDASPISDCDKRVSNSNFNYSHNSTTTSYSACHLFTPVRSTFTTTSQVYLHRNTNLKVAQMPAKQVHQYVLCSLSLHLLAHTQLPCVCHYPLMLSHVPKILQKEHCSNAIHLNTTLPKNRTSKSNLSPFPLRVISHSTCMHAKPSNAVRSTLPHQTPPNSTQTNFVSTPYLTSC